MQVFLKILVQYAHTQLDTLVADIGSRAGNNAAHLFLMLTTEGTAHRFVLISGHSKTVLSIQWENENLKERRQDTPPLFLFIGHR
jgi:hypothetical protein